MVSTNVLFEVVSHVHTVRTGISEFTGSVRGAQVDTDVTKQRMRPAQVSRAILWEKELIWRAK